MAKYSNWVKKAEAPDIENFYAFTGNKKKKSVLNFFFCLSMFIVHIVSGLINPPSSHSFLVFYPYAFIFLPFAFLFYASVRLLLLPETISKKQWDASLGSLKHSDIGLILASAVCLLCELIYVILHQLELRTSNTLPMELIFCSLQIVLVVLSVLYGVFYDKNFSGI